MNTLDCDDSRSVFERFLGLFADVRAGEGTKIGLLALNVSVLSLAYFIARPASKSLAIEEGGARMMSYVMAAQAILLLGMVELYAALASRLPRRHLINVVTLFFAACLGTFYILAKFQLPLGMVFYVWVGVANVILISQFWAFANDLYTPEAGRRLFAILVIGGYPGTIAGSFIANRLVKSLGAYETLLVSGVVLGLSSLVTKAINSRDRKRAAARAVSYAKEVEEPLPKGSAFRLIFQSKYLLLIALLMLLLNWVNTTGEYILSSAVADAAEQDAGDRANYIGEFYSDFFLWSNLASLLILLFVASRILKYLGVGVALLVLPVVALGGYALFIAYPVLGVICWGKAAGNSIAALQFTTQQVLFLPVTREQKYKARLAIYALFPRVGNMLSALLFLGGTRLAFGIRHFASVNLSLVLIWVVLAVLIGRENRKLTSNAESLTS